MIEKIKGPSFLNDAERSKINELIEVVNNLQSTLSSLNQKNDKQVEEIHDWWWALAQLKSQHRVRRKAWTDNLYIHLPFGECVSFAIIDSGNRHELHRPFVVQDFSATDWERYEP